MATVQIVRGNTLPDSSSKSDFHNLIDQASGTVTNISQSDISGSSGIVVTSASAPSDTDALWKDTSVSPSVLKYHNGTSWTQVTAGAGTYPKTFLTMGA